MPVVRSLIALQHFMDSLSPRARNPDAPMTEHNSIPHADSRHAPARAPRGSRPTARPFAIAAAAGIGALAVAAVFNRQRAKQAERDNPPAGRFVEIGGVRLHYIERGAGEPLVLLHGNGSMVQDFESSGLIRIAAEKYRVIAFDRPGFGHSERPRATIWTPEKQADLIHAALTKIGIPRAIVLGHSWGASVATALALKYPHAVSSLVLASGYYYPSARADVVFASGPAVPVIGDLMRYTLAPILGRVMWPLVLRKIFGPASTPQKFGGFPKEMALRPSQIRATAAESALMIPNAIAMRGDYAGLKMPLVIVSGDGDRLIDTDDQSARLHEDVPHSTFHRVRGAGHMVHQTAPAAVMSAIDEAAAASRQPGGVEGLPRAA
jgi:pimeloyl-ACP methyl ester carboxylesterase